MYALTYLTLDWSRLDVSVLRKYVSHGHWLPTAQGHRALDKSSTTTSSVPDMHILDSIQSAQSARRESALDSYVDERGSDVSQT